MCEIYQVFSRYDQQACQGELNFRFCPNCANPLELTLYDGRVRPVCPACGFIQFINPAPAVAILVVRGDQVLLGKRSGSPDTGKWATPSGYIEFDEDFLSAAIREVKEETGLEVEIRAILNVASSFISPKYHFFSVYLLAHVIRGELAERSDLVELRWYPLGQPMPELAFKEDEMMIARYSQGLTTGLPVDPRYARLSNVKSG